MFTQTLPWVSSPRRRGAGFRRVCRARTSSGARARVEGLAISTESKRRPAISGAGANSSPRIALVAGAVSSTCEVRDSSGGKLPGWRTAGNPLASGERWPSSVRSSRLLHRNGFMAVRGYTIDTPASGCHTGAPQSWRSGPRRCAILGYERDALVDVGGFVRTSGYSALDLNRKVFDVRYPGFVVSA